MRSGGHGTVGLRASHETMARDERFRYHVAGSRGVFRFFAFLLCIPPCLVLPCFAGKGRIPPRRRGWIPRPKSAIVFSSPGHGRRSTVWSGWKRDMDWLDEIDSILGRGLDIYRSIRRTRTYKERFQMDVSL